MKITYCGENLVIPAYSEYCPVNRLNTGLKIFDVSSNMAQNRIARLEIFVTALIVDYLCILPKPTVYEVKKFPTSQLSKYFQGRHIYRSVGFPETSISMLGPSHPLRLG
jgi:hypothetical protein